MLPWSAFLLLLSPQNTKLQTSSHTPNNVSLPLMALSYTGASIVGNQWSEFRLDKWLLYFLKFGFPCKVSYPTADQLMGLKRRPVTSLRDLGKYEICINHKWDNFPPLHQNHFQQIRRPGSQAFCSTASYISGKSGGLDIENIEILEIPNPGRSQSIVTA